MKKKNLKFWGKIFSLILFVVGLLCSNIFTPYPTFAEGGNLLELSVNEGTLSPTFAPNIKEYTAEVANNVTTLDITALLENPAAQQLFIQDEEHGNGIPWTFSPEIGNNTISIKVYDPATDEFINTYTLIITRAAGDPTNADLKEIKTSTGAITPAFDPTSADTEYTVNVEYIIESIEITATPADSSAAMTINEGSSETGTQTVRVNLEPGENSIPLTVTSGDENAIKTYTLQIIRGPSSNADLKGLTLTLGSAPSDQLTLEPDFDSRIVTYTITEPREMDRINILATLDDPAATLTINGETAQSGIAKKVPLDQGGNLIPIVVTASDEVTEKAYIVSINGKVSNADLATLQVTAIDSANPGEPVEPDIEFDAMQTDYAFTVDNTVDRLTIAASPADPKALLMLNGTIFPPENSQELDLAIGENTIHLMVIAQDTSTQTYTLKVSRGASLAIETSSLPLGLLGDAYAVTPTAKGGKTPYTWSSTDLPAGLSLNPTTGEISGIPEAEGTYEIQITVTDAQNNSVTKNLTLQLNLGYGNGGYLLTPVHNPAYTIGHAVNGFPIMTVTQDVSDFLHFPVKITPIDGHTGKETVVFVHLRKDMQMGINTAKTDFDLIPFAQTTFEVQAEDLIKVYMVDDLQSDPLLNPNIL